MNFDRPRVAVLAAQGNVGGAERSLAALMAASGEEIAFTVLLPEAGTLAAEASAAGAAVRVVPWEAPLLNLGEVNGSQRLARMAGALPAMWRTVRTVRAALNEIAPDVVVTNGIKPHCIGALAAGRRPAWPLIWYLRDSLEERRLSRQVLGPLSKRCAGAVAISNYVSRDARHYLRATVPVRVIYNIVTPHRHTAPPADVAKEPGSVWFAMIGALTPIKGHDLFLRAAATVSAAIPSARFVIVGGAGYRTERRLNYEQQLRSQAMQLGIADRTLFLGHRDDVQSLLSVIDVLVQPNTGPEGFGRSVAEAMAAGIPVIATDGWSLSELIEHDSSGWLFPKGDAKLLGDYMLRLGQDVVMRRRTADAAAARVRQMFSAAVAAQGFKETVTTAAGSRIA